MRKAIIPNCLHGRTYVIDGARRGLAHVPFPAEGVAVATVKLGRESPPGP